MSRRGFTLLEVLVALTLAGMAVLLAHRGLGTLVDVEGRASRTRVEAGQALAVRRQVVSWLYSAAVEGNQERWDFEGTSRVTEDGSPDDVLGFITLAPGPFEPGRRRMVLHVLRDDTLGGAALAAGYVSEDSTAVEPADPEPRVLVHGASGLAIRYLHTVDGERTWTPTWSSSVQLPEAIELRILGDSVPPLLRFPIFVVPRGGM